MCYNNIYSSVMKKSHVIIPNMWFEKAHSKGDLGKGEFG